MINLSKEICLRLKEARQSKGYNQSALARLVGCKQSAISMFEAGMTTKLSDETVKKISEVLGVPLGAKERSTEIESACLLRLGSPRSINGFCPNDDCLSNIPYVVSGRLFYRPLRLVASPTGGMRCTQCGEMLEMQCPACGAALNDGACCAACGNPYVTPTVPDGTDIENYAQTRREMIMQFRSFAEGEPK